MTNFSNRALRTFAFTVLAACSPKGADTGTDGTDGNTTGSGSTASTTGNDTSTGETTGTSTATTDATGPTTTTTLGTTTVDTTTGPGPVSATDSDSESDGESESDSDSDCASTCGTVIECEHPDVLESLGAPPCEEGFHCDDQSDCGCALTFCVANCDPSDPNACATGETCDARSGACVPA
ncbi:hypothetical protein [Nannocystis exedens]|nr:hypothetical protein [Nannocystis exedens]